ncbi:dihydropteroate synthase [Ferruginibacter sp. SUN002]|uniref:dihydropteroate synthase n=1 Tax=Ferruginibacter sp. SUN002 TaxID=2937789 RepID=UPI003D364811
MYTLNCKGKLLVIDKPLIMGIINVTPDSFYKGNIDDDLILMAEKMLNSGANILDLGGQSTRPKSIRISVEEELQRVLPAIENIHKNFPEAIISIDTYYSDVAKAAVNAGASIVNDISAGNMDVQMIKTVAGLKVPYICMHMQGSPDTMQENPQYNNVTKAVTEFFITKINECKNAGITDIIVDPGFGFGKTVEQNYELLRNLSSLKILDKPILAGLSRKSMIWKALHTTAENALNGTIALNTIALLNGASILRVHDVKEAKDVVDILNIYSNA